MKSRLLLLAFILMVPIGVFAQNITVKGNVTDSEGEPIIGATVMEKGKSQNGVITDLDGNFTLNVSGKGKKDRYYLYRYENGRSGCSNRKDFEGCLKG